MICSRSHSKEVAEAGIWSQAGNLDPKTGNVNTKPIQQSKQVRVKLSCREVIHWKSHWLEILTGLKLPEGVLLIQEI